MSDPITERRFILQNVHSVKRDDTDTEYLVASVRPDPPLPRKEGDPEVYQVFHACATGDEIRKNRKNGFTDADLWAFKRTCLHRLIERVADEAGYRYNRPG